MDKKGLSEVVTTLIIILLVLVAIGIVWAVVNNILSSGSEQVGLEQFSIDVNFLRASINGNAVTLTVKRAAGNGNMSGLKFILSDGSNSEEFSETSSLTELQEKTFVVTLISLNPVNLRTAAVAPVFIRNGKETIGDITDTYTFGSNSFVGGGGNDGGDGSCVPACTGDDTCVNGVCVPPVILDCVPACTGDDTCVNGVCVPPGCTEPRTDVQVCSDAGAVCGTALNICGNFVDCDIAIGGCSPLNECILNACYPLTFVSGTVDTVWPTGVAIYFDSSDLPSDEVYSGYYAKFLAPSQESECLLVENYDLPQLPQTKVMIRLQAVQTSVDNGDSVQLWPTFESCMV